MADPSSVVTVDVTLSNPSIGGTPVYMQHKKESESSWPSANVRTVTTKDLVIRRDFGGLDADTAYNIRASLTSDFSAGVRTLTVRTAASS